MTRYWKSLKIRDGKIVSDHDGSPWEIGVWREVPAPERECVGLNCCPVIVDAMGYVAMEVLAEVEIAGTIVEGDDKITAQKMRILKAWRWQKKDSVAMAVYAAELCVQNFEKTYPKDPRPRQAIEAAKKWIIDPTEKNESAAESAAWLAAESAADSAAWSAESAARSAAESAADSAAWSAKSAAWLAWLAADSAAERLKLKKKIDTWIIKHLKECEAIK